MVEQGRCTIRASGSSNCSGDGRYDCTVRGDGDQANRVIKGIGDKDIGAGSVHRNTAWRIEAGRAAGAVGTSSVSSTARQGGHCPGSVCQVYLADGVVVGVGHVNIAGAVHRHALRVVERGVVAHAVRAAGLSVSSNSGNDIKRRDEADGIVLRIGDVEVASGVHRNVRRIVKFGIGIFVAYNPCKCGHIAAGQRQHPDHLGGIIRDEKLLGGVINRQIARVGKCGICANAVAGGSNMILAGDRCYHCSWDGDGPDQFVASVRNIKSAVCCIKFHVPGCAEQRIGADRIAVSGRTIGGTGKGCCKSSGCNDNDAISLYVCHI